MSVDRDRLVAALSPVVSRAGYDLEDIEVAGAGKRTVLRVVVDRDGGFGLDDVADLSRDVSAVLDDADDLVPGAYVLEVSSPGVDRPLTLPRHWRRNVDRLVLLRLSEGETVTGRIQSADDTSAVIEVDSGTREVGFDAVALAKVQIELRPRRPAASAAAGDVDSDEGDGESLDGLDLDAAELDDLELDDIELDDLELDDIDAEDGDPEDGDTEDSDAGDRDQEDGDPEDTDADAASEDHRTLHDTTQER